MGELRRKFAEGAIMAGCVGISPPIWHKKARFFRVERPDGKGDIQLLKGIYLLSFCHESRSLVKIRLSATSTIISGNRRTCECFHMSEGRKSFQNTEIFFRRG
jgi:hypothetical protein